MSRDRVPPPSRRDRRAQTRLERPPRPRRRGARAQTRPAWQSPVVLVTAAAVLIGVAIIAFARPPEPATGGELITPPTSYPAALVDGESLGAADAPVVMELYSDFQCPACKLFVTTLLPGLVNEFVGPGTLRIEARDIDILGTGTPSESLELAAGATCAAEQDRYWPFHDLVFWNQGRENRGDHDAAFIGRVADRVGLDRAAFDACFAGQGPRTDVRAQTAAALGAGIGSTPTLVVNGQRIVGVPRYEELAGLIRQLAEAQGPGAS